MSMRQARRHSSGAASLTATADDLRGRIDAGPGQAIYLYCLTRDGGTLPAIEHGLKAAWGTAPAGLDPRSPPSVIRLGEIAAVVGVVNIDDFCGPTADVRLNDLTWVAPRVCTHEMIVESVMRVRPVIPARFGTLFSSCERLVAWLAAHEVAMDRALDAVQGREEWAVQGWFNKRAGATPRLVAPLPQRPGASSRGARYLEARRVQAQFGHDLYSRLQTWSERALAELRAHAADFRARVPRAERSSTATVLILNWAFLVERTGVESFHACVQRITAAYRDRGFGLEYSGPWPPYSFCPVLEPTGSE